MALYPDNDHSRMCGLFFYYLKCNLSVYYTGNERKNKHTVVTASSLTTFCPLETNNTKMKFFLSKKKKSHKFSPR